MAVSRAKRRSPAFMAVFGEDRAALALDLLEVMEFAWHHCYRDITPPPEVVDDLLLCSEGRLDKMISCVRAANADWRDLRLAADRMRGT